MGAAIVEEVARTSTQVGNGADGRIDAQVAVQSGETVAIVDRAGSNCRGGLVGGTDDLTDVHAPTRQCFHYTAKSGEFRPKSQKCAKTLLDPNGGECWMEG